MSIPKPLNRPEKKEQFVLWFMIFMGFIYMFFLFKDLLKTSKVEFAPLFWMLMVVLFFNCLTIIYEWTHYLFITVPQTPQQRKVYTVDIFTTFCAGEPYEMIDETLTAIQAISYPHQTYLCDESNDPYLKEVCKRLNVHHVTRTLKIDAKAGNINNALKHSTGELCVVLDPDHVPCPEFLDQIIFHFENPEIGFVQIVQAYKNYRGRLIAKGAAQQTFQFYGPIMMTMNKYGTVLAIGANCTFRRTALESIGGHAAGLAEDMHTAMQLHAKGWKSVYVPSVLARGLVPDTLSAYYSQQLKWSRGVFELFFTSYFKLFKNFTWQQKIHYGVIPLHYFSGVIFLINFLIPVISLFFNISPINLDLVKFGIMGFPLFMSIILIRHYVQAWVMEDEERGFHFVGGLLLIGTWWVYIVGLVYTIFRIKVPYIPTPKNNNEDNNWYLNIPNIAVIILSVGAIFSGLYYDLNPYTLIMAGFAAVNCVILSFTIVASRQQHFRRYKMSHKLVYQLVQPISYIKNIFWKARHRIYNRSKNMILPMALFIACLTLYWEKGETKLKNVIQNAITEEGSVQLGIFAPLKDGITSVQLVKQYQQQSNIHFSIISYYVAWGDIPRCYVPVKQLDSVYKNGSIPMITWEPWQVLFEKTKNYAPAERENNVFKRIVKGNYDHYLNKFSNQVKSLKRPIYLRFAHETDNPAYPWSGTGKNTPNDFKAAWKYVYTFFQNKGVTNVIWVWNPWKPDAVKEYFPGKDYVDWLGVTNLNYGSKNLDKKWRSMEELYYPFHQESVFKSGIPVMLAEMGSIALEGRQEEWFRQAAVSINGKFPEIKAIVLFNNGSDQNILTVNSAKSYDWRVDNLGAICDLFKSNSYFKEDVPLLDFPHTINVSNESGKAIVLPQNTKGINYLKGKNWFRNNDGFTKEELLTDFANMKQMGINTIKWNGPGIYDYNVFTASKRYDMKIDYSFLVPNDLDFVLDNNAKEALSNKILETVNDQHLNKNIISWHLANPTLQKLRQRYNKPVLLYHQEAYMKWLKALVVSIKKIDAIRPVTIDVEADTELVKIINKLHSYVPEIDSYGLLVSKPINRSLTSLIRTNYFYSKISVQDYISAPKTKTVAYIANWQDEDTKDYVSFDGIIDKWGKNKYEYYILGNRWNGLALPNHIPPVKILLPAVAIYSNDLLAYHALIFKNHEWQLAQKLTDLDNDVKFKWVLVKNDNFGNSISLKILGSGPSIDVKIPEKHANHQLYLYVTKGKDVQIIKSKLNTPLY